MPDDLDQIATASPEDKKVAGLGIALQRFLDLKGQSVHAAPHIRSPDRQPDPHITGNRNHRRTRCGIMPAA
jgi:hypothetical protein